MRKLSYSSFALFLTHFKTVSYKVIIFYLMKQFYVDPSLSFRMTEDAVRDDRGCRLDDRLPFEKHGTRNKSRTESTHRYQITLPESAASAAFIEKYRAA